jgi:RNA polymerase sigma-70 factor (ECF subfamily)
MDSGAPVVFATTRWSLVRAAGNGGSPEAEAALETLCRGYWRPIYVFIRRFGHDAETAQDLTQVFFQRLLSRNYPGQADPRKGRFRSFLLVALNHFLIDERARSRARKRGGDCEIISIDALGEEDRLASEPVDEVTPETLFERRWTRTILDAAERRLEEEFASGGKSALWGVLRHFLPGEKSELGGAEAAQRLGVPENTLKSHAVESAWSTVPAT